MVAAMLVYQGLLQLQEGRGDKVRIALGPGEGAIDVGPGLAYRLKIGRRQT